MLVRLVVTLTRIVLAERSGISNSALESVKKLLPIN